uniref:Sushi domain-containing protein n=1 Tax=Anolis carolinensis TaxID=28377 RepID=A0A803THV5_ANOCA
MQAGALSLSFSPLGGAHACLLPRERCKEESTGAPAVLSSTARWRLEAGLGFAKPQRRTEKPRRGCGLFRLLRRGFGPLLAWAAPMPLLPGRSAGFVVFLLLLPAEIQGDCPAPRRQPDATLRGGPEKSNYPVGTVLRYDCIPGYQFKPGTRPTIRCQANSKWSSESSLCERKPCKPPTIDNGKFEGDIRLGDEITFSCDFGFRLLGQATSRCILTASGSVDWSRSPPYCDSKIICSFTLVSICLSAFHCHFHIANI